MGTMLGSASSGATSVLGPYEKGQSDGRAINANHAQGGDVGMTPKLGQCETAVGGVGFIRFYNDAQTAEYVRGCLETVDGS